MVTERIEYEHQGDTLEGVYAFDDSIDGDRPAVLVIHEWRGLGDYAERRARQLADLGYAAFALDMYGKGVYAEDHEEAAELSGMFRDDRTFMRNRAGAGLDVLLNQDEVDTENVAAIGYCFGGSAVLELARSGADLDGVVSFHGGLTTPDPSDAENITGEVLIEHGGADSNIGTDQLASFIDEMESAGVDYEIDVYGGVVHSFTNPSSGFDKSTGSAYDAEADRKSWQAMQRFFGKIFNTG